MFGSSVVVENAEAVCNVDADVNITADVLAVVNVAAVDPVVAADATVVIAAAVAADLLLLLLPFPLVTVVTRNDTVTTVRTMPV